MKIFLIQQLRNHWQQGVNSPLARRFVVATILCSSLLAVILTILQLYIDYRQDISSVKENIHYIERSRVPAIIESLWSVDEQLIETQLQGILQLEGIEYVAIINNSDPYTFGLPSENTIEYSYPLKRTEAGRLFVLGELQIRISLQHIYSKLLQRALLVLASNFVKTLLVAAFIVLIYHIMIGQHLLHIAHFARQESLVDPFNQKKAKADQQKLLDLQRHKKNKDEIDDLEESINEWLINQKKYFQEQQQALYFQKLLMNVNTDLIFVKDSDLRIIQANQAFYNLYTEKEDIIGHSTIEKFDEQQAENFISEDKKAFSEGFSEVVEVIDFPDGSNRVLLTKKLRFEDYNNNVFILGISRDITALKQAEDALVKANTELEEFAYRTSHDLRSPLISAVRLLSIIKDNIQQEKTEHTLKHIDVVADSLKRLENLVDDILKLTQLKYTELSPTLVDVADCVDKTLNKFTHMDDYSRLNFQFDYRYKGLISITVEHFTVVLENLLSNAIKYQDTDSDNSFVHISTENKDNQLLLTITDNGIGIPRESQDKVFNMFKRFHPKRAFGSGLGLYMVKRSIEKMAGNIEYKGLPQGSQFIVTLPIA